MREQVTPLLNLHASTTGGRTQIRRRHRPRAHCALPRLHTAGQSGIKAVGALILNGVRAQG